MDESLLPEKKEPERNEKSKGTRVYFIDWMRVVAIYMVVTYHVIQALDWVNFFDTVPGMGKFVVSFRASALQIGMPMFFHISGRAHALAPSTGFRKTVVRRVQRLLVPFFVCYLLIIPPWQYIDKEYDWKNPSSFHMKANVITWLLGYYTSAKLLIYFDMAWLWFLPALFLIVVLSNPLFQLAEYRHYGGWQWRAYRVGFALGIVALVLSLVGCGFNWRFAFFAVAGPTSGAAIAQIVPLPPQMDTWARRHQNQVAPSEVGAWLAARSQCAIQLLSSVGLVLSFGYEDIDPPEPSGGHDPRAAIPFFLLCAGFYIQGYFGQRWSEGCREVDGPNAPWWVQMYRLFASFVVLLIFFVSSPLGDVETGHFIYPIYSTSYSAGAGFGAVYVLGTWAYLVVFVSLFEAYGDHIVSPRFYKHATRSTTVVYIFHWVFVKVFAFWMLIPTLKREGEVVHSAWVTVVLMLVAYFWSVCCSLGVYFALLQCPKISPLFGL